MQKPPPINLRLVGWLSLAQLISWGSIFYTFALVMEPVERDLGLLWTPSAGYTHGLWLLLALSAVGVGALMLAQRLALRSR